MNPGSRWPSRPAQTLKADCPLCGDELEFTFRAYADNGMATLQTDSDGRTIAYLSGSPENLDHSGCTGLVKNVVEFG